MDLRKGPPAKYTGSRDGVNFFLYLQNYEGYSLKILLTRTRIIVSFFQRAVYVEVAKMTVKSDQGFQTSSTLLYIYEKVCNSEFKANRPPFSSFHLLGSYPQYSFPGSTFGVNQNAFSCRC